MITEKLETSAEDSFYRNESNTLSICKDFVYLGQDCDGENLRKICLRIKTKNPKKRGWMKVTKFVDYETESFCLRFRKRRFFIHWRLADWLENKNLSEYKSVWVSIIFLTE